MSGSLLEDESHHARYAINLDRICYVSHVPNTNYISIHFGAHGNYSPPLVVTFNDLATAEQVLHDLLGRLGA